MFMKLYNLKNLMAKTILGKILTVLKLYITKDLCWYSPNGMYADGYVFSVKQARKVLRLL